MQRGIRGDQELDPSMLLRDTRTMGQRIVDFFKNPANVAMILVILGASVFYLPQFAIYLFFIGVFFFLWAFFQKQMLPCRLPQIAKVKDYNDLIPGIKKPRTARGIAFFGNDRDSNEELWFANDDMRTHVLIFGSTGSGKTEALVSLAYNSLRRRKRR